jgi:hypothetical protein
MRDAIFAARDAKNGPKTRVGGRARPRNTPENAARNARIRGEYAEKAPRSRRDRPETAPGGPQRASEPSARRPWRTPAPLPLPLCVLRDFCGPNLARVGVQAAAYCHEERRGKNCGRRATRRPAAMWERHRACGVFGGGPLAWTPTATAGGPAPERGRGPAGPGRPPRTAGRPLRRSLRASGRGFGPISPRSGRVLREFAAFSGVSRRVFGRFSRPRTASSPCFRAVFRGSGRVFRVSGRLAASSRRLPRCSAGVVCLDNKPTNPPT